MSKSSDKHTSYRDAREAMVRALDDLADEVPDAGGDYHRLFNYYVGQQCAGVAPSKLNVCDRAGDQKLDFYHYTDSAFSAYQCKLPDFDAADSSSPQAYGPDVVNELEDMLTFLTDESGAATGNRCSQEARNRYRTQRDAAREEEGSSSFNLQVRLAVFGILTPQAQGKLTELQSNWKAPDFDVEVVSLDQIETMLGLAFAVKVRPDKLSLHYMSESERKVGKWGYALIHAKDLFDAFDKYRMSLFDLNVRYYLKNSSVNRRIIEALETTRGIEQFHLLNNGVTFSCQNLGFRAGQQPGKHGTATLHEPQIINGCQTVISMFRARSGYSSEQLRREFDEKCLVPARFIDTTNRVLLDEIVTASNNQNKMSARNLVSNSRTQRQLATRFRALKYHWFYQRKDGEMESLRQYKDPSFKPDHYRFSQGRYRIIDNEALAKAWLSFIGFSRDASERIMAFEREDEDGRYDWLFERVPVDAHWSAIAATSQVQWAEESFRAGTPAAEQYLLAYVIYEFARHYPLSHAANRRECTTRLRKAGKVTDESTPEEVGKKLMDEDEYVLNQILMNAKEVVVELFAWILINCYGPLTREVASKLLSKPHLRDLFEKPDFRALAEASRPGGDLATADNLFYTCMEFIKDAVRRWYAVNQPLYQRSQRRIRFMHQERTIEQLKDYLRQTDSQIRNIVSDWKPKRGTFLQSLPRIDE